MSGASLQYLLLLGGLAALALTGEAVLALASRNQGPLRFGIFRPFYAISIGQWILLTLFAAFSAFGQMTHTPGMGSLPLFAIPALAAVFLAWSRARRAQPIWPPRIRWNRDSISNLICLALIGIPILYVTQARFGLWFLPSSDPDIHAFHARLVAEARGWISMSPHSDVAVTYPLGFGLLNGLWILLTRLNPLEVVGIQPFLQYFLAFGLMLSVLERERNPPQSPGARIALTLGAVLLLQVVAHPVLLKDRALLEGTSRLTHFGLALQAVMVLLASLNRKALSTLSLLLAALCCAWTVSFNPAHVPVTGLLILLAVGVLRTRGTRGIRGQAQMSRPLVWAGVAFALVQAMNLVFDPYLSVRFLGRGKMVYTAFSDSSAQMPPVFRVPTTSELLEQLSLLSQRVPQHAMELWDRAAPQSGAQYGFFITLAVAFTFAWAAPGFTAKTRRMLALLLPLAIAALLFLIPELLSLWINPDSPDGLLFAKYMEAYSRQWIILCVGVWMILTWSAAWESWSARIRSTKMAAALFSLLVLAVYFPHLRANAQWIGSKLRASSLSYVAQEDIRIIDWIRTRLDPKDRVLLLGMYWGLSKELQDTPEGRKKENWIFPLGVARALPLLTDQATAFFYMLDGSAYSAFAYRDHVWGQLDLPWVDQQGLKWVLGTKEAAPSNLAQGFRPCVQTKRAALWVRTTEWEIYKTRCESGLASLTSLSP